MKQNWGKFGLSGCIDSSAIFEKTKYVFDETGKQQTKQLKCQGFV
jgi:hypothetical protein